ncbi:MAG: cytochrome c1 [Alphaproteobacteria bacterium]|nr:cytochrome c1 [Alphaproteobacteria bacterium]
MKKIFSTVLFSLLATNIALAASDAKHPIQQEWAFDGFFGKQDVQSIQRGFQVYREVCSACHGIHRVAYRNLKEIGFTEGEIKTIAQSYTVVDGPNDDGEMFERPGRPADYFVPPYKNEKAARAANNGAYPLDLSLIIKAREDGANYVYSLLNGYDEKAPEGIELGQGLHYNPYMAGGKIAMAKPLSDGQVTYADGTSSTVEQMSKDVVNFLQWTAEPEMNKRKYMGVRTFLYLLTFTLLFYFVKRRLWSNVK